MLPKETPDPADEACSGASLQIYPYPHSRNKFLSYFCNLFGNQLHLVFTIDDFHLLY
jgi:hypothetical protein